MKVVETSHRHLLLWLTGEMRKAIIEHTEDEDAGRITAVKREDVTRMIDRVAEDTAVECLRSQGFSARIISEETKLIFVGENPEFLLIMDPLDGSSNLIRSLPFSSISIALASQKNNVTYYNIEEGAVRDISSGVFYYAGRKRGSYRDNDRLVTSSPRLEGGFYCKEKPLISLYAYDSKTREIIYENIFKSMITRTFGSIALELCYVAESKLDAVVDLRKKVRLVDVAAGGLILEEAGGVFREVYGEVLKKRVEEARGGISLIAARDLTLYNQLISCIMQPKTRP